MNQTECAGGRHWRSIGNQKLQDWNRAFRQTKLPFGGWRSADTGYFHFFTKPTWWPW
jgi:hypothetical protein